MIDFSEIQKLADICVEGYAIVNSECEKLIPVYKGFTTWPDKYFQVTFFLF